MSGRGHGNGIEDMSDDARLESLGYTPQLDRVLGQFANFSVAFTYLSPMVGIYSLFALGIAAGGPAYVWLTWIPVAGMLFVALVFGELASHYPVAGALYQYSKFSVGPTYGWFVGWFYGIALLITVAAVDTGVVPYVAALTHNWFGWSLDPANHLTILLITVTLAGDPDAAEHHRRPGDGPGRPVRRVRGDRGHARHRGDPGRSTASTTAPASCSRTESVQNAASNPLGLDFGGNWLTGAALIAVLAPVFIFYGFESAGDISEETKDAGVMVPRSMRNALVWGGVSSFVLVAALLLAMPDGKDPVGRTVEGGGVPFILASLPSGLQDFLLLLIIFAFFSCGTSVQGAGSRLAFSYARDGALPGSSWLARVNPRFKTPTNALIGGGLVSLLFVLLVFYSPSEDLHLGFITYPADINALVALVSFGVSGIYLSFLLTVVGALVARSRGWAPEGRFRLGRWGWAVNVIAAAYLGLMLLNVVAPTGLASPRGYFNLDWITLLVMVIVAVVGLAVFALRRPGATISAHGHDPAEVSEGERPPH